LGCPIPVAKEFPRPGARRSGRTWSKIREPAGFVLGRADVPIQQEVFFIGGVKYRGEAATFHGGWSRLDSRRGMQGGAEWKADCPRLAFPAPGEDSARLVGGPRNVVCGPIGRFRSPPRQVPSRRRARQRMESKGAAGDGTAQASLQGNLGREVGKTRPSAPLAVGPKQNRYNLRHTKKKRGSPESPGFLQRPAGPSRIGAAAAASGS